MSRTGDRNLMDPTTSSTDYAVDEVEFMTALDRYKRSNHRPWPTCREVLLVLKSLGYRKVAETDALPRFVCQHNHVSRTGSRRR